MEYSENVNVIFKIKESKEDCIKLTKHINIEEKKLKIFSHLKKSDCEFNFDLLIENKNKEDMFNDNKFERLIDKSIFDGLNLSFFSYGYKKTGKTETIKGLYNYIIKKIRNNNLKPKISNLILEKNKIIDMFINKGEILEKYNYINYDKNINFENNNNKYQIINIIFKNVYKENNSSFTKIALIDFGSISINSKSIVMGNKVLETIEKNSQSNNFSKLITILGSKNIDQEKICFDDDLITKTLKEYLNTNYLVNFIIHILNNNNDLNIVLNTLAFSERIKQIPQNTNLIKNSILNKSNSLSSISLKENESTIINEVKKNESTILNDVKKNKNKFKKKKNLNINKDIYHLIETSENNMRIKELIEENNLLKKQLKCNCIGKIENIIIKNEKNYKKYIILFDEKFKKLEEITKSINIIINKKYKDKEILKLKIETDKLLKEFEYKNIKIKNIEDQNINLLKKHLLINNKIIKFKNKTIDSLNLIKEELSLLKLKEKTVMKKIDNSDLIKNIINKLYYKSNNNSMISNNTEEELIQIKKFILKLNKNNFNKKNNIISIKNKSVNYNDYIKFNFSKKDSFEDFKNKFKNIINNLFNNEITNNIQKYNKILHYIIRELLHLIIDINSKNDKLEMYKNIFYKKFFIHNNLKNSLITDFIRIKTSVKIIEKYYILYKERKYPKQIKYYKILKGKYFLNDLMEKLELNFINFTKLIK